MSKKTILLTQGKKAIICDCHYDLVKNFKWSYKAGYAGRSTGPRVKQVSEFMHRVVANTPKGQVTDHINDNKLDNRCSNLRTCRSGLNVANSKLSKSSSSGYKGVNLHPQGWRALIKSNGQSHFLGYYKDKKEAAKAYNEAALKLHGEYARLNEGVY